jgi:hypothetical protein
LEVMVEVVTEKDYQRDGSLSNVKAVATKLGSLHSALAWTQLRLRARPSLENWFIARARLSANGQEPSAKRLAWLTLLVRPDCATAAFAQANAPFRQPSFVTPGNYLAWSCQL